MLYQIPTPRTPAQPNFFIQNVITASPTVFSLAAFSLIKIFIKDFPKWTLDPKASSSWTLDSAASTAWTPDTKDSTSWTPDSKNP